MSSSTYLIDCCDVLKIIFSYIDVKTFLSTRLVCKTWFNECQFGLSNIRFSKITDEKRFKSLVKIFLRNKGKYPSLCKVSFIDCKFITENELPLSEVRLTGLNLTGCYNLRDEGLYYMSTQCSNLLNLNISRCDGLFGSTLPYLKFNPNLKILNLSRCFNIQKNHFLISLKDFEKLNEIDVSFCSWFNQDVFENVLQQLTELKKMEVANCSVIPVDYNESISKSVSLSVEFLNISGCLKGLVENDFRIEMKFPMLKYLIISKCTHVVNKVFSSLSQSINSHSLLSIDLSHSVGINKFDFVESIQGFVNLESLNLAFCKDENQEYLVNKSVILAIIIYLKLLKVLNIEGDSFDIEDLMPLFKAKKLLTLFLTISRQKKENYTSITQILRSSQSEQKHLEVFVNRNIMTFQTKPQIKTPKPKKTFIEILKNLFI